MHESLAGTIRFSKDGKSGANVLDNGEQTFPIHFQTLARGGGLCGKNASEFCVLLVFQRTELNYRKGRLLVQYSSKSFIFDQLDSIETIASSFQFSV